jgi:hypothetical protein
MVTPYFHTELASIVIWQKTPIGKNTIKTAVAWVFLNGTPPRFLRPQRSIDVGDGYLNMPKSYAGVTGR